MVQFTFFVNQFRSRNKQPARNLGLAAVKSGQSQERVKRVRPTID